jgi:1,4-dihydroxy-2-naphthoate octaprenyltransferase
VNLFINIFLATRPKTLVAIVAPILVAAAIVKHTSGQFHLLWLGIAFLSALLIQVATNFYNDAVDGELKRDTKKRLGPKRFSAEDPNFLKLLKTLALLCLALSFILGLVLTYKGGLIVLAIGVPALFLAYIYTGTRFSLSSNGVADVFVIFYFGVIPVWLLLYITTGVSSALAALMGLQCGLLSNALLVVNNLRDEEEDRESNKKTIVVRFGRSFGLIVLAFCLFLPYLINLIWFTNDFFRAGLWTFTCAPLAFLIFVFVKKNKPSNKYNLYLALTAVHLLVFSLIFALGVASS